MEFNPLDLLACAAELQQRNKDDSPENKIMTRQRRANSFSSSRNKVPCDTVQKENKDLQDVICIDKNNGANVRKYKVSVNSDLEKMLDEHNYGNAKKSHKLEKNIEVVSGDSLLNQERTGSVSLEKQNSEQSETGEEVSLEIMSPEAQTCLNENQVGVKSTETEDNSVSSLVSVEYNGGCDQTECVQFKSGEEPSGDKATGHTSDSLNTVLDTDTAEINSPKGKISPDKMCTNLAEDNKGSSPTEGNNVKSSAEVSMEMAKVEDSDVDVETVDSVEPLKETLTQSTSFKVESDMNKLPTSPVVSDRAQVRVVSKQVLPDSEPEQPRTVIINISKTGSNTSVSLLSPTDRTQQTDSAVSQAMVNKKDKSSLHVKNVKTVTIVKRSVPVSEGKDTVKQQKHAVESIVDGGKEAVDKNDTVACSRKSLDASASIGSNMCNSCDTVNESDMYTKNEVPTEDLSSPHLHEKEIPQKCSETESGLSGNNDKQETVLDSEECSDSRGQSASSTDNDTEQGCEKVCISDKTNESVTCTQKASEISNMECCRDGEINPESDSDSHGDASNDSDKNNAGVGGARCDQSVSTETSANDQSDDHLPVFRFVSDHCYAGIPGKIHERDSVEERDVYSEEASTPSACSSGELSQDSGYGDITQSPDSEMPRALGDKVNLNISSATSNISAAVSDHVVAGSWVPIQENSSVSQQLSTPLLDQIAPVSENPKSIDSSCAGNSQVPDKVVIKKSPSTPAILTLGTKSSPVLTDSGEVMCSGSDRILGLLRPTTPEAGTSHLSPPQVTPTKFGKFRIGTFASFSNTSMGLEESSISPVKTKTSPVLQTSPLSAKLSPGIKTSPPVLGLKQAPIVSPTRPWKVDVMGTVVTVREDLKTGALTVDTDHIQHDHDYCTKNYMPSVVNSAVESRLQRESGSRGKYSSSRLKKLDMDLLKTESKGGKRKKAAQALKEDFAGYQDRFCLDENMLDSSGTLSRAKTRAEKYIEQKSVEPKVKITGSSNFQDQFVYFMNTKKRSRRRESRESPLPLPTDKVLVQPPKPGDIIVPHLTDDDIEALKLRSKQKPSLKPESSFSKVSGFPTGSSCQSDSTADEESKIINTILSLENEGLQGEESYSEPIEMYGQGGDIMNLLPEQMNLTQEQMDLLYSAVDEVQNSSPGLVDSEKLGFPGSSDSSFGVIPSIPRSFVNENLDGESSDKNKTIENKPEVEQESIAAPIEQNGTPEESGPISSTVKLDEQATSAPLSSPTSSGETTEQQAGASQVIGSGAQPKDGGLKSKVNSVPGIQYDANSNIQSDSAFGFKPDTLATLVSVPSSESFVTSGKGPFVGNGEREASCSPVKTLLQSTPLAAPSTSTQMTQDLPLPTLDKSSLDLLGNDFRLDKTDLFPEASVPVSESSLSTSVANPPASGNVDYSTPWIATVSMYWNDLPAILINNLPFVRLVDIHKQILPAKDTGILKKRCQLLGIEVGNCSEMQRYFLVQYGKAVNSKSTLIVSKDDAKRLIGYYVEPPPKSQRTTEEHKSLIELRRESLKRIALARRAARPPVVSQDLDKHGGAPEVHSLPSPVEDGRSPRVPGQPVVQPVTSTPSRLDGQVPDLGTLPSVVTRSEEDGRGTRPQRSTRHKKINFLELLRGDSTGSSPDDLNDLEYERTELKGEKSGRKKQCRDSSDSSERAAKRTKSQKVGTEPKVGRRVIVKLPAGSEESMDSDSEESETEEDSELMTSEDAVTSESDSVQEIVIKKAVKKRTINNGSRVKKSGDKKVVKPGIEKVRSIKVKLKAVSTVMKPHSRSMSPSFPVVGFKKDMFLDEENVLTVVHKDLNQKNGHRNRSQLGEIFVDKYDNKKSLCIRCYTCRRLMSVDSYLQHLHDQAGNGRLVAVTQPQVIEPNNIELTEMEKKLWETFQHKKDLFENNQLLSPEAVDDSSFMLESNSVENGLPLPTEVSGKQEQHLLKRPGRRIEKLDSVEGVRVSSRKRKQKQLYPFENYTYVKKLPRLQIDSCGEGISDKDLASGHVVMKMSQLSDQHNVNSDSVAGVNSVRVDVSGIGAVENTVPEKGGVVTLTNGPELTTFTALQDDLEM